MSRSTIVLPSIADAYPERSSKLASGLDGLVHRCAGRLVSPRGHKRRAQTVERIVEEQARLIDVTDAELADRVAGLRRALRSRGIVSELVVDGFALIREVSRRRTGMQHYRTQIAAGLVMLDGAVAEMETGEGKTLAVTLPAALVALAGVPVHVITVNDYLARRDASLMMPIYEFLGLSVGEIVSAADSKTRRRAYRCDVAYCTNNEIVFDYLRDRLLLGDRASALHLQFESIYGERSRLQRLFLKGLRFAIVDEADSVLIDETRTPLILSAPGAEVDRSEVVSQALAIQEALEPERACSVAHLRFEASLTPAGRQRLGELTARLGGVWRSTRLREQLVRQAIEACHLYRRDQHYVLRDGKVQIVDQHTGRVVPGRTWSEGVHQFVEAKEGCELTPDPTTLARISYQSFFRRYVALSGMTGTAREVAGELWSVYGLRVVTIPPRRASRRRYLGTRTLTTLERKWAAVVAAVAAAHERSCPVLVGTNNVATSEHVSTLLSDAGLLHAVLNAKQDDREAEIISRAGERDRITVATNMAGRGTDIKLGPGVAGLGGLHVILTEFHDAARIDRQLVGRSARQGDPGSYEVITSLEDPIVTNDRSTALVARCLRASSPAIAPADGKPIRHPIVQTIVQAVGPLLLRLAQRRVEGEYSRTRQRLLQADEKLNSRLAFAGRPE